MWCSHCQQDVPAVPGADPDRGASILQCVRCQQVLAGKHAAASEDAEPAAPKGSELLEALKSQPVYSQQQPAATQLPPMPQEDWQLEAELRYVERLAHAWRDAPPLPDTISLPIGEEHSSQVAERNRGSRETNSEESISNKPRFAGLAWAALSLGVMCFVCGGVLLAWAAVAGRQDLWSLGLPLTLAGQAGLIVGLVLQLETLWQTNRATSQTLQTLDGEIHELRHSTTLLTQSRSNPAQSFYLHLAEGASPHLLLADLKGQLDLLSEQMAKRR
jgi:hypothetical protein